MKKIEIINPYTDNEPLSRIRIKPLLKFLSNKCILEEYTLNLTKPDLILINSLNHKFIFNQNFIDSLIFKKKTAKVILFVADLYPDLIKYLFAWNNFVDEFIVATPELKKFIERIIGLKVKIYKDALDFCIETHIEKNQNSKNIKIAWFGFAESYEKSLLFYEDIIKSKYEQGCSFNIFTKNDKYGAINGLNIVEYNVETFVSEYKKNDLSILSHAPFDFSISTEWKSENKAVLSIALGVPVIASNTPSYERLLRDLDLSEFIFDSKFTLSKLIDHMIEPHHREDYLKKAQKKVIASYSARKYAENFYNDYLL